MLIVNRTINYEDLRSYVGRPEELVRYVEEQIPKWARHIECLAHNQRYYIAIHLRSVQSIPYKQRMELVNALIEGIHVKGIISSFTTIGEILDLCDKQTLAIMLKETRDEQC